MESKTLKIIVTETIKTIDVFFAAHDWAKTTVSRFVVACDTLFKTNSYTNWKAIPVRGPDVVFNNLQLTRDYSLIF